MLDTHRDHRYNDPTVKQQLKEINMNTNSNSTSTEMTAWDLYMDGYPVSYNHAKKWAAQDVVVMDSAAKKLIAGNVNPWVFCGDDRHFDQFSDNTDVTGIAKLSDVEYRAVMCFLS